MAKPRKPIKTPKGLDREPDTRFADLSPSRAWGEWIASLSTEERQSLALAGVNLDEPTRDLRLDVKDGTLDRTPTTGKFVRLETADLEEPETVTFDREVVLEIFRRFLTVFDLFPYDRSLSLFGKVLSIAVGLPDAPTAKEVADKYGRTKQAISKRVGAVAAHLNLPPSFRMISTPENLERVRLQLRKEQRERRERERVKAAKKAAKKLPKENTLPLFPNRENGGDANSSLDK
jgi:hypothetical protein